MNQSRKQDHVDASIRSPVVNGERSLHPCLDGAPVPANTPEQSVEQLVDHYDLAHTTVEYDKINWQLMALLGFEMVAAGRTPFVAEIHGLLLDGTRRNVRVTFEPIEEANNVTDADGR